MCTLVHTRVHTRVHICAHMCPCVLTHVHTRAHTCAHVCIHMCGCGCWCGWAWVWLWVRAWEPHQSPVMKSLQDISLPTLSAQTHTHRGGGGTPDQLKYVAAINLSMWQHRGPRAQEPNPESNLKGRHWFGSERNQLAKPKYVWPENFTISRSSRLEL